MEQTVVGILLGFAPFVIFAVLTRFADASVSLWAAALTSAILLMREKLQGKSTKILGIGTLFLFGLLGTLKLFISASYRILVVRAAVDAGLLLIVFLSLLFRHPFTLQYAREETPGELQDSPLFIRVNYVVSSVWAAAMAITVLADFGLLLLLSVAGWVEVLTIAGALVGAIWFTGWYPRRVMRISSATAISDFVDAACTPKSDHAPERHRRPRTR